MIGIIYKTSEVSRKDLIMKSFVTFVAVLVLYITTTILLTRALDTPMVYVDINTKKCLRVEQPSSSNYSCSRLPEKYETVWVGSINGPQL